MAIAVKVHEAKASFSKLVKRVQLGEEIVISKAGKPVARLVPFYVQAAARTPGTAKGTITMSADFDAPLPKDLQEAFEEN